ncbi:ADP-ribosyl cyclase/cyclic ADP-ribose hydrolase 1 [Clonorchis sinensis]|nr:ADP-ribosyl cyclase/cyclic ADP-ribose hydrolase 1 [Clonorchis sinensis]
MLVTGRCSEWAFTHGKYGIDCQNVWTEFEKILTGEQLSLLCTMDPKLFDPFVDSLFKHQPKLSKPFFWSGARTFAIQFCRNLGTCDILESTLPGYTFNDLDWCDTKQTAGKVYRTQCGCTGKAELVYAFWKSASSAYSKLVEGDVGLFLNGSFATPYDRNRTFGSSELPNLNFPRVTKLTTYLVYPLEEVEFRPRVGCNSENLMTLKVDVQKKNISYECIEQPAFALHYLCASNPTSKQCLKNKSTHNSTNYPILTLFFFASIFLVRT